MQTEFDTAGRVAGVRNQSANWYYAGAAASDATNRIQYASHGAISGMKLGNGRWEHTTYNNRLQPTLIGLGASSSDSSILKLDYGYGTTNNNGNVLSQTITIGTTVMTQSYGYDALNRLSSATETGAASWSQNYGYDRFGNRWYSSGSYLPNPTLTPQAQTAFDQLTNRLAASLYDNAGNQTRDAASSTFTYDAENRQISSNVGGLSVTYNYDGDGHRVKKVVGTTTTVFVYNAGSQLIAEYTSPDTISNNGLSYMTSDHLGSTRVVTDINGYEKARHDYLPFGEEIGTDHCPSGWSYGGVDGARQKFTQKERDNESGLDYFLARYYSSSQGRFASPDPYLVVIEKEKADDRKERNQILLGYISQPQVWNKYVYVINNPLKNTDPDGRRELTDADRTRLNRLLQEYNAANAANMVSDVPDSIGQSIKEISEAIDAVPEGQDDPAALQAVFWAIDQLGDQNYTDSGSVSNNWTADVGPNQAKCNIFVANAYALGAGVGFNGGEDGPGYPTFRTVIGAIAGKKRNVPAANDLADSSKDLKNLQVNNGYPRIGDVAAWAHVDHGHSAIYIGGGAVIYAQPKLGIIVRSTAFVDRSENSSATYRSYKP